MIGHEDHDFDGDIGGGMGVGVTYSLQNGGGDTHSCPYFLNCSFKKTSFVPRASSNRYRLVE